MLAPLDPEGPAAPAPDLTVEPSGFVVTADDGARIHFLEWSRPVVPAGSDAPGAPAGPGARGAPPPMGVLLVHGVAQTAWAWAPVARRLAATAHVVAPDLRGHGLSDAPADGYDLATLAGDALAVAEGAGLVDGHPDAPESPDAAACAGGRGRSAPLVLAGHGFGAAVAATLAVRLGSLCSGLVLVDGGWDDTDRVAGTTLEEWVRSAEEPPEVLRTMAAFLADREAYDPTSWDLDQERAARASVVELPAGRVVSSARRHAIEGVGAALLAYDASATLASVAAPIVILVARDDAGGARTEALVRAGSAVAAAGGRLLRYRRFPGDGHNLMRYRPGEVAAAILAVAWVSD